MMADAIISILIITLFICGLAAVFWGLEAVGLWLLSRKYRKMYEKCRDNRKDVK